MRGSAGGEEGGGEGGTFFYSLFLSLFFFFFYFFSLLSHELYLCFRFLLLVCSLLFYLLENTGILVFELVFLMFPPLFARGGRCRSGECVSFTSILSGCFSFYCEYFFFLLGKSWKFLSFFFFGGGGVVLCGLGKEGGGGRGVGRAGARGGKGGGGRGEGGPPAAGKGKGGGRRAGGRRGRGPGEHITTETKAGEGVSAEL